MSPSAPEQADHLDAIVLSPHKFVGGPGASGLLVADRAMFRIARPSSPWGGTVSFVTPPTATPISMMCRPAKRPARPRSSAIYAPA
ncbi:MAG: hypothetical protein MO852_00280 [Candidatus Devosia euplotis]|nr:hypothetical protein [Candidatus Devosia euplotis]